MSEEITVRFKWSADDLRTGMKNHYRAQYPRLVHIVFWTFICLSIFFGALSTFRFGTESNGFPMLLYGFGFVVLVRVFLPWNLRRQFSKRPDHDAEIEWRISEEGLRSKTPHGKSEVSWAAFFKVVETKRGFLFYPSSRIFHWLPRAGFASDLEFEKVSQLAEKNAKRFKRVD